jgi:hypothetical protein
MRADMKNGPQPVITRALGNAATGGGAENAGCNDSLHPAHLPVRSAVLLELRSIVGPIAGNRK